MGKPSIFSKDYDRRMQRRKKGIWAGIIIILLLAVAVFAYGNFGKVINRINIKSIFNKDTGIYKINNKKQAVSKKKDTNKKKEEKKNTESTNTASTNTNTPPAVTGYDVTLSNGSVKAIYDASSGTKKFTGISPSTSQAKYSINPSGSGIVILDPQNQNLTYVDINGNVSDITKKNYISTSNSEFDKDTILKGNPSYVWCSSPAFIDDTTVAYVSQLPYFNSQTTKYVWSVDVSNKDNHICYDALKGQNISFGAVTSDKGITVTVDGNVKYLSAKGQISE